MFTCTLATSLVAALLATPRTSQQLAEMKAALCNLVVAEEKHWADHGTTTTDASVLGLYPAPKGTRPRSSRR